MECEKLTKREEPVHLAATGNYEKVIYHVVISIAPATDYNIS